MKCRLLPVAILVLCLVLVTPALAQENPYRNAGEVSALDIPVPLEAGGMKSAGSSDVVFSSAGYTHTIGRATITMEPLDVKGDGKATVNGNVRRYRSSGTVVEHEVYRDLVKERVILNASTTLRYSYDLALSDWVTIETDESRPVEVRDANNTVIVTYPHTKQVTNYAKDSTIDISPDRWGNLVVYVNGEDVVVMPKPFAIDAAGQRFEMDFKLDKKAKTITVAGDLAEAKYPVTVDPTERVTNGGFETGDKSGWSGSYSVASGGAYQGTYYLNVVGSGGYTTLTQTIDYTGATSVSNAVAIPVSNVYDIPMSDIPVSGWHWLVNAPGQYVQGWTPRSTSPGLTGSGNIVIWTYSSTRGYVDSVSVIAADPPVAQFTGTPLSGTTPLTVQFTDQSTNAPTSWSWSFGDGGTSTAQTPSHQYTSAGTYTVSLTATNAAGSDGETKTGYVVVTVPRYSMTSITIYTNASVYPSLPYREEMHSTIQNWLTGTPGWSEQFYALNTEVEDTDFGTQDSGYLGLDDAALHYHYGHGGIDDNGHTYLPYTYWPNDRLTHDEVYKKWDTTNKWVIMDACYILSDPDWKDPLKYSHGILGFMTEKAPSVDLPNRFLQNCIDNDYTVSYAWQRATEVTYLNSGYVAGVRFDTMNQLTGDHLPGQGTVMADEYPDDDNTYNSTWTC